MTNSQKDDIISKEIIIALRKKVGVILKER